MSLKDAVESISKVYPPPKCTVGRLLARMPKDDAKTLQEFFDDPETQFTIVHKGLLDEGYEIGYDSLRRHRKHLCKCSR